MEMTIILVLLLIVVVMVVILHRLNERGSRNPRTWPLVGAQLEVSANINHIHDWCLRYFTSHHRTLTIRLFLGRTLHLTVHPPNLHHILKSNFHNYPKGERLNSCLQDFLGRGIFNSDGETWMRQRQIACSQFSNKRLRELMIHAFREDAVRLLNILHSTATAITNSPIDIQDLFMRMTMNSICKIGFGMDAECLSPLLPDVPFGKAFDTVNELISSRVMNPFWKLQRLLNLGNEKILKENMKVLNDITSKIIQKRRMEMQQNIVQRENKEKVDLLSRFLANDLDTRATHTDGELRDIILNFVIAGRDTIAVTLSWFIYCICKHPEVGEKIYKESLKVLELSYGCHNLSFEETAKRITYESLGEMHYLHAALTETLRLFPAVPRDGKTVLNDDVLPDGTRVRKGDQVSYVPYAMGRMEFLWGKDASVYNPNRWIKDAIFQSESPFKFSAFQAGPRICLGKEFAYLQMKMTAALLVHFFKFKIVDGHIVHYRVMLVLAMANGLLVNVSYR